MRNSPERTLLIAAGGCTPNAFHSRTVGAFGAETHCGDKVVPGDTVWMNSYGDTLCDPCAQRRAVA